MAATAAAAWLPLALSAARRDDVGAFQRAIAFPSVPHVTVQGSENVSPGVGSQDHPRDCVASESCSRATTIHALHLCASTGSAKIMRWLLADSTTALLPVSINAPSESGSTALMCAMAHNTRGCRECVDVLLDNGADADLLDEHGNSALHIAVGANNGIRVAQLSRRCPRSLRSTRSDRRTPLHLALELRNMGIIQALLDAGAPLATPVDCEPLLHLAIRSSTREATTLLLQRGVSLTDVDATGATALDVAADRGDAALVLQLLASGADACCGHPLAAAVAHANIEIFMLLLTEAPRCGVDAAQLNAALCAAANAGHAHMVRALLALGASADARDGFNNTALQLAARRNHGGVCALLLASGAAREEQGGMGMTALAMARMYNCPAASAALVLARANVVALRGRSQGRVFPQRLLLELGALALSRRAAALLVRRRVLRGE